MVALRNGGTCRHVGKEGEKVKEGSDALHEVVRDALAKEGTDPPAHDAALFVRECRERKDGRARRQPPGEEARRRAEVVRQVRVQLRVVIVSQCARASSDSGGQGTRLEAAGDELEEQDEAAVPLDGVPVACATSSRAASGSHHFEHTSTKTER